jgi:coatomer protein complex subunit alpha (xenin)
MNSEKNADSRSKAQKVLQKSEQQGRNEYTIDYDERNPFSLDCASLKPLYKGTPLVKCSYCAACYAVDYKGKLCLICGISTVSCALSEPIMFLLSYLFIYYLRIVS